MALVYPTRMELQKTKRKLGFATKGHKFLTDKLEMLIQKFMELVSKRETMRNDVLQDLSRIATHGIRAFSSVPFESYKRVISNEHADPIPFSGSLIESVAQLKEMFPRLEEYIELIRQIYDLAGEIETTRRRVNALEYFLIPDLRMIIKTIDMKLGEMERSRIVSLMKR
ncbi:V-type ATP synthase subunit D [Candidatus Margulisiibacteriota bacterium]